MFIFNWSAKKHCKFELDTAAEIVHLVAVTLLHLYYTT